MTIQIENYGFMLVLYLLCFVYLFFPNTELVCLIFLTILNIFYLVLFYNDINNYGQIDFLSLKIPTRIVVILWWLSLMISNSWFINTYRNLRKKFENSVSGIKLGEKNNNIKKHILILLVCNMILFLFLHLLSIQNIEIRIISLNMVKIIITFTGVTISSILLYLNNELSTNTKIITTQ